MEDWLLRFISSLYYSVFILPTRHRVAIFCDKQPVLESCKILDKDTYLSWLELAPQSMSHPQLITFLLQKCFLCSLFWFVNMAYCWSQLPQQDCVYCQFSNPSLLKLTCRFYQCREVNVSQNRTLYKLLTHRLAAYLHIHRLVLYLYIIVIKVFYSTNIAV